MSPAGTSTVAGVPPVPVIAPPAPTPPTAPPYAVVSSVVVLTDATRPTPARGDVAGHPGRVLRTLVVRPLGLAGPLPAVVFAHGYDSEPERYEILLDAWAAAGFVVAAPESPGSAADLPGTPTESDIGQQAGDLSFVLSSLLTGAAGVPVDPARVVAAGHSDGGSSVVALAMDPAYADRRFVGYLALAGQIPDGVAGPWTASSPRPLVLMVGTDDEYGTLPLAVQAYDTCRCTKALVTIAGGTHLGPFVGGTALAGSVRQATVRYLDLLAGSAGSEATAVSDQQLAAVLAPPAGSGDWQVVTG